MILKLKKFLIIHPILLAVYPVLFLYSRNTGEVGFSDIVKPILTILAGAVAVWVLLSILIRNLHKSAMITSLLLLLFFSYGHIRAMAGAWAVNLPVWLFLFVIGSVFIIRIRKPPEKGTIILNTCAVFLVAWAAGIIGVHKLAAAGRPVQQDVEVNEPAVPAQVSQSDEYPDIYFIVLDAYARQDVLREIYDFDNSDFIKFLRDRGFYVADRCAANYCQTGLSFGSCLNMTYLHEYKIDADSVDREPLKQIIKQSRVGKFLKEHGYKTVSFASHDNLTNLENSDLYLKGGVMINKFHSIILNTTILPDIIKLRQEPGEVEAYRQNIRFIFDNIGKVPRMTSGPKFVFAHIEIPHPPFIFGPKGKAITVRNAFDFEDGDKLINSYRLNKTQYKKAYCDQVRFVNSRMKQVIDEILSNSSRPPIIVLVGDHGPRSGMVWENLAQTDMRECLSILGAFYMPDGGEKQLYPNMTLVNLFRAVFNYYFDEKFDFLPNRCYFSGALFLYSFTDVTDRVRQDSPAGRVSK